MSVISKSTINLGPRARSNVLSIEKKAWFMCKILCRDLSGSTFARIRDQLDDRAGIKTRVKLSNKGWRVGSKLTLNPKVQYELYPFAYIDRILQDIHYTNVLLVVLVVVIYQNDLCYSYEVLAYKFKSQSAAFRFQDLFQQLSGRENVMERAMSRTELSLGSLALVPAKNYPMGLLAVDRWGGPQAPRSEASYARGPYHGKHSSYGGVGRGGRSIMLPASAMHRSGHDERSDLGSFDSSDTGTTTFKEVAVSANISAPDKNEGRPVLRSETNLQSTRNVSDSWCQADTFDDGKDDEWQDGEVRAVVNPHHRPYAQHFNGSILSDDSRRASSSGDNSAFYGRPEVTVAYVHGPKNSSNGFDEIDGTVSVRKVFNKHSRNNSSKASESQVRSNTSTSMSRDDQYYQYRNVQVMNNNGLMGKKARSIGNLGPSDAIYRERPYHIQQAQLPVSRGPSRTDLSDNVSVASQRSVYLLNPKFKKVYMRRDNESAYSQKIVGQY